MQGIEVWKNNALLNAKSQWNTQEQKLFNILLSDLNGEKSESFTITKIELEKLFKAKLDTADLKKLTKSMIKKGFSLQKGKNSWMEIQIFSSIAYENGIMTMNLTRESLPHLYELKSFTKYMLEDLFNLSSKYAIRVFELLKREQFKQKASFSIPIDEFREFVGVTPEEYAQFSDFDKYVLKKAEKEINKKTNLKFKYEKIKQWRTIKEIKFIYLETGEVKIPQYMNYKEFSKSQLKTVMEIGLNKTIEINNRNSWSIEPQEYIQAQARKTKESCPDNFFGYFKRSLEEDWAGFEESRKLEKDQISIDDIKVIPSKKKESRSGGTTKKPKKDFEEREYDYDALERKLLGWDK